MCVCGVYVCVYVESSVPFSPLLSSELLRRRAGLSNSMANLMVVLILIRCMVMVLSMQGELNRENKLSSIFNNNDYPVAFIRPVLWEFNIMFLFKSGMTLRLALMGQV